MVTCFTWGVCFVMALIPAIYHNLKAKGALEAEFVQSLFQYAASGLFLLGFILFVLSVRRRWFR